MQASTFKQAIDNKRFLEAEDMVKRGDDILKSQWAFKLSDAFPTIIENNAFHLIHALTEHKHIELDIYEYDQFQGTIFEAIALHINDTEDAIAFINEFLPQIDNLNDNLQDHTWLGMAMRFGAPVCVVQAMIDNGCSVNYLNNAEQSYLHVICSTNHYKMTNQKLKEYAQILLDQGLDVNKKDKSGSTPLHFALDTKKADVVELLLEQGADPNLPDNSGFTPFGIAINNQRNVDICKKMMEYAPIDFHKISKKKTSLFYDFIKSCISSGISDKEIEFLQLFEENQVDIYAENINEYGEELTPIDLIAVKNFEFFEAFVDLFDIDVNHIDDNGNTLLHKVCAFNVNFEEKKAKDLYRKAKKLVQIGFDPKLRNNNDKTPIDLAGDDNLKEKTVALLLKT